MVDASARARVAIFGSGKGTTAQSLIEASSWACYDVCLVVGSRLGLGIADVAAKFSIAYHVMETGSHEEWSRILAAFKIDVVALAGWLKQVPSEAIEGMHGRMLNVHPSLLPKFGGHGMYGRRVHSAVLQAGEAISGATVHAVTAEYDAGPILAQEQCSIAGLQTSDAIESVVRNIEKSLYPNVLHRYCSDNVLRHDVGGNR